MSGIILGENNELNENPFEKENNGVFHCYFTNLGMILCFVSKTDEAGNEHWDLPLVLETISQRNPSTGEITRSQGFRPLIPLTKETKFTPLPTSTLLAVEIKDAKMEAAYRGTVRDIKAQLSGIVLPPQPSVGTDSGIIVGA